MTAQEQFAAEREIINNSQHDGLVDIARAQPNLESSPRRAALAPAQQHAPAPGDITSVLGAAQDGDTIQLQPGQYTAQAVTTKAINVIGAPIDAAGNLTSKLKFSTGGNFAIAAAANSVFDLVDMENNGGLILFPNGSGMARVSRCAMKFNGTGSNACGIRSLNGNSKLVVDRCYFHDSPNSYRDMDLYGQGDVLITGNEFEGTNYGSHIDGPKTGTVTIAGNTGTKWNRNMGIEVQDHGQTLGVGAVVFHDNVFYGFGPQLTNNTYGASLPVQNTGTLTITDNYIACGDFDAQGNYTEAPLVAGSNIGIGLETGSQNTICTGNTIVGKFCVGVVTCQPKTAVSGNKVFGRKKSGNWGNVAFSGEPGNRGAAGFIPADPSTANTIIETIDANTPKPPRRGTRQPWMTGATPPPENPMTVTTSPQAPFHPLQSIAFKIDGLKVTDKVAIDLENDNAMPLATNTGVTTWITNVTIPASATAANVLKVQVNGVDVSGARFAIQPGQVTPPGDFHVDLTGSFDIVNGKPVNVSVKPIVSPK